jgi:signal transduction histidine kinase
VIGGAVLILGLLLLLTGLVSARIPGEATFASSGLAFGARGGTGAGGGPLGVARRAGNPIRAFLLSPIHPATWYANGAIGLGLFVGIGAFAALASVLSAGLATLVAGVGIVLLVVGIEGSRLVARFERRRMAIADPRPLTAHPYRPLKGGPADLLRAEFADESRWRDVLYVALNFPLAVLEFMVVGTVWVLALVLLTAPLWDGAIAGTASSAFDWFTGQSGELSWVAVLVGAILLPVAASLSQLTMTLHRTVVAQLICTSEAGLLRRQVETLKESRSAVLNVEASELRRIERDLHDGAQQRLVMLTINLGMAAERMDADPEAARTLVLEGREQARQALADLRSLVRGIAPAILIDRGLVAAISSIAARGAVPTSVQSDLPPGERLPEAVERAAYFVVAEALTNVAKHSGARRCEVRCQLGAASLVVEVWDDGKGDARPGPGGGLAGLAGRVEALDGTFSVSSPAGGPTLVRAELPVPARVTTPGT